MEFRRVLFRSYFRDNLDCPGNRAVLRAGQWPVPLPPGRPVQLIPAADMAHFAALVIERPGDFAGRRVELASDQVTGPEAARILSAVLRRPVAHRETVPAPLAPMAPFFRWLAGTGFDAGIGQLRAGYPEIGWHSLRQWATAHDWADLASASAGALPAGLPDHATRAGRGVQGGAQARRLAWLQIADQAH